MPNVGHGPLTICHVEKRDFPAWLQRELDKRGITPTEFSREAELEPSTVTRILNGERGAGRGAVAKIAHALKVADSVVLYQAGFLERDPEDPTQELDPLALEILQMVAGRPDAEQAAILATERRW